MFAGCAISRDGVQRRHNMGAVFHDFATRCYSFAHSPQLRAKSRYVRSHTVRWGGRRLYGCRGRITHGAIFFLYDKVFSFSFIMLN